MFTIGKSNTKLNSLRKYFVATNVVYLLAHALVFFVGISLVAVGEHSSILLGIGASLVATGTAGWVIFVHVLLSQRTAERLDVITSFGFINAFSGRAVTIRPEYDERLNNAHSHIDIMGFGLSDLRIDYADDFPRWASKACVRVLLLDPDAPTLNTSYADARDLEEGDAPGSIRNDVAEFVEATSAVRAQYGDRFQVRLYTCLPNVNIFRIDNELFWGPYLLRRQSRHTPTFLVQRGVLYDRLLDHFEKVWSDDFSHPLRQN